MIKATCEKGNTTIVAEGSADDIFAETCIIVREIYDGMKRKHEEDGEQFRRAFEKTVSGGTIWKNGEQLRKAVAEQLRKTIADRPEVVFDILDHLLRPSEDGESE